MTRKNNPFKMGCQGFTLVELIVVITVMAVLGGILVPQFLQYVSRNRATACQVDREAILAVYERCIYAKTQELATENLDQVLKCEDPMTKEEVQQYNKCPSSGAYTAEVSGSTAIIHCSHTGHDDVLVDMVGWEGEELAEGIDPGLPAPPFSPAPDTEPPAEEDGEDEDGTLEPEETIWPYADDARWEGKRFPGQYIEIDVPVMFSSKEGNTYIFIDGTDSNGKFKVYWEWNLGPENIDTRGKDQCIPWSGVTIEDIEGIRYYEQQTDGTLTPTDSVTGIHYGDIIIYEGRRYVYASVRDTQLQQLPTQGQNGNDFYLVD